MNDIGESIRTFRRVFGVTQKQLAEVAGVSDRAVSAWEKGTSQPRVKHLVRIMDHFGVGIDAFTEEAGMNAPNPFTGSYGVRASRTTAPLYAAISAGTPIEEIESEGEVPVPEWVLEKHPRAFFLRVSGESMNRVLPNGSYAFVDPDADIVNGDAVALNVNGHEATIKRMYRGSSSVTLMPDSVDDGFKDVVLDYTEPDTDEVTLIGRVVWYVAPYGQRL